MARPQEALSKQLDLISARCGLSPKHLRTLIHQGMPTDLEQALAWLNHRPSPKAESDSAADLRRERIRLTRAQSEKAELELSIRRNEVVSRAEVREMFSAAGHGIRAGLLSLENELVPKITGKSLSAAREIARDELRLVMVKLQDAESDFWQARPLGDNG